MRSFSQTVRGLCGIRVYSAPIFDRKNVIFRNERNSSSVVRLLSWSNGASLRITRRVMESQLAEPPRSGRNYRRGRSCHTEPRKHLSELLWKTLRSRCVLEKQEFGKRFGNDRRFRASTGNEKAQIRLFRIPGLSQPEAEVQSSTAEFSVRFRFAAPRDSKKTVASEVFRRARTLPRKPIRRDSRRNADASRKPA